MQSAEDRIGTDCIGFPVAMARTSPSVVATPGRRIGPCARNVTSSDWVCHECALVWLGRGLASAASG